MEIVEAIKSIPEKKESLREAFEALQSSLSSLSAASSSSSALTLQWKWNWGNVEGDISYIEANIYHRFGKAIRQTTTTDDDDDDGDGSSGSKKKKTTTDDGGGGDGSREKKKNAELLKSVCINMDAKRLLCFLNLNSSENRLHIRKRSRFLSAIGDPLSLALRSFAPDPALLVLNVMYGFNTRHPPKQQREVEELLITRETCIYLLEVLHPISLEFGIKPALKEKALSLALEWKYKIPEHDNSSDNAIQALAFLRFLVAYGLVPAFKPDAVIDLLCTCIVLRRADADLIKNLGITHKAHDLVQKLIGEGRELDAVKIVCALDIAGKFPPVPLLKAYITRSKQRADELRMKGNNSVQAQNAATNVEIAVLQSVIHAIKEYKLERVYPRKNLTVRIAQLEYQKKSDKKQAAASVDVSTSKAQQQQQSKKRPHPSPATSVPATSAPATSAPVIAANSYPQSIQPHPGCELAEHPPYMGMAAPCGPTAAQGFTSSRCHETCYSCRRVGHKSRECPSRRGCYKCGSMDHIKVMCPHQGTCVDATRERTPLLLQREAHHQGHGNGGAEQDKGHVIEERELETQEVAMTDSSPRDQVWRSG